MWPYRALTQSGNFQNAVKRKILENSIADRHRRGFRSSLGAFRIGVTIECYTKREAEMIRTTQSGNFFFAKRRLTPTPAQRWPQHKAFYCAVVGVLIGQLHALGRLPRSDCALRPWLGTWRYRIDELNRRCCLPALGRSPLQC